MKKYLFSHNCFASWATFIVLSFLASTLGAQDVIGGSNYNGVTVTTSSNASGTQGANTISDAGLLPNLSSASRFLSQAAFGADIETIEATANQGFESWIDTQLELPVGLSLVDHVYYLTEIRRDSFAVNGEDPNEAEAQDRYWRFAWWQYVMTSPDILRSRMALALSEIFVISEVPNLGRQPLGMASYYDMLLKNSLGNYRDLLLDVSLHPMMGDYLTHLKNQKTNREKNTFPDQNYAREIQQLFSIGLFELALNGERKTDTNGDFIPTYDNEDIAEFSKVFTGLGFGDAEEMRDRAASDSSYTYPMKMFNEYHEPGVKFLLGGAYVPNRNPVDGMADIEDAVDNLYNHPNVGPFLAKRLIQRFVKSNPSPDYIARVASKFNNNGSGVRGDLKAMVRAILLDPEARDCALADNFDNGMLREPIAKYVQFMRAFNAASPSGEYRNTMGNFKENTEQRPLSAPSVFNFFQPDFQPIGPIADMDMVAPEFQITNSLTTIGYANEVNEWTFEEDVIQYGSIYNYRERDNPDNKVAVDLAYEQQLSDEKKYDELIERLDLILAHGKLSDRTKEIIEDAISQVPDEQSDVRLQMALFLVLVSPEYQILR